MRLIFATLLLFTSTVINGLPTYNVFDTDSHKGFDVIALDSVQTLVSRYITHVFSGKITPMISNDGLPEFHLQDENIDITVNIKHFYYLEEVGLIESTSNNLKELKSTLVLSQPVEVSGKYEAKGTINGQQIDYEGDFTMETSKADYIISIYLKVINPNELTFDKVYGIKKMDVGYNLDPINYKFNGIPADIRLKFENLLNKEVIKFLDKFAAYETNLTTKFVENFPLYEFLRMLSGPKP